MFWSSDVSPSQTRSLWLFCRRHKMLTFFIMLFMYFGTWIVVNQIRVYKFNRKLAELMVNNKYAVFSLGQLVDFDWDSVYFSQFGHEYAYFIKMRFSMNQNEHPILSWIPFIGDKSLILFSGTHLIYTGDSEEGPNRICDYSFTREEFYLIAAYEKSHNQIEHLSPPAKIFCDNLGKIDFNKNVVKINDLVNFSWNYLVLDTWGSDGYYGTVFKFYDDVNTQPIVYFILPARVIEIPRYLKNIHCTPNDEFIFVSTNTAYCFIIGVNKDIEKNTNYKKNFK